MTRLAVSFQSINIALISVEFRSIFDDPTFTAWLLCRSPKMPVFVLRILGRRIPSQIFKFVISRVRVRVVAGVMVWTWRKAHKRQQHEPANLARDHFAIDVKSNRAISIPASMNFKLPRGQSKSSRSTVISAFSFKAPNCSVASRKVVRESRYWADVIFHSLFTTHIHHMASMGSVQICPI